MKRILAFLLLTSTCQAQILGPVSVSTTAQATAPANITGDLIDAPESVPAGRTFVARIKGDIPWEIKPADTVAIELLDRQGNIVLLITAASKDITLTVSHRVAHPTDAEIKTAIERHSNDKEAFAEYLKSVSADEIYQDSHTVTVGSGPEPGPDPPGPDPPKPPDDPQARKVYDAAITNKLPAAECKQVSENMRAVIAEAVATSIPLDEIRQKIKAKNEPITGGKPGWEKLEQVIPTIFTVTSREQAIAAYEKIADGLGAVK